MTYSSPEQPAINRVITSTREAVAAVYHAIEEHNARVFTGDCTCEQLDASRRDVLDKAKRVPGLYEIVLDNYNYAVDRFTPAAYTYVRGVWNQFALLESCYETGKSVW